MNLGRYSSKHFWPVLLRAAMLALVLRVALLFAPDRMSGSAREAAALLMDLLLVAGAAACFFVTRLERRAQEQLVQTERRIREAQKIAQLAVWELDLRSGKIWWSDETYQMYDISKSDAPKWEDLESRIHPEDLELFRNVFRLTLEAGSGDIEFRIRRPNGEIRRIHGIAEVTYGSDRRPILVSGTNLDVTDYRRVQERLLTTQRSLELALQGAELATWDWNVKTGEVLFNSRWAEMRGYRPEEIAPSVNSWLMGVHPDDLPAVRKVLDAYFEGKIATYESEHRVRTRSGEWIWILDRGKVFERDSDGKPLRMAGTEMDITERKRLSDELNRAQAVAHIGSWRTYTNREEVLCSPETYRIFGFPLNEPVTYDRFLSCIHPDDREFVHESWQSALRGAPYDIQHRIVANGKVKWVRERAELTYDESRRVTGGIGTVQDITDFRKTEGALEQAKIAAEEASRAKDRFLATLSHELRTPLTAILGWSQLLRTGTLDEDRAKVGIRAIDESARAQNQLIDDLLDVSRIISGKLWVSLELSDVQGPLRSAIEAIRLTAEKKGIQIEEDYLQIPMMASIDTARMKQVFWNLLSNSVKFSPNSSKITVSVRSVPRGEKTYVEIRIRDTGKGIAQEFIPKLFDRFSQEDSSSIRAHGGLGLGLALVKSLLEVQNGSVHAESGGEGKGSTFVVMLPMAAQLPLGASIVSRDGAQGEAPDLRGIRILLVDDEKSTLEALSTALGVYGAEVKTAGSAGDAFPLLRDFRPGLIVSDIAMPGEDGYSFIRKVRMLDASAGGETPAIALSAFAGAEYRERALVSGYQQHLSKPVDVNDLAKAVQLVVLSCQPPLI